MHTSSGLILRHEELRSAEGLLGDNHRRGKPNVTLREAMNRLDEFAGNTTLYIEGDRSEWHAESDTAVGVEDVEAAIESLPPEAEGRSYFLEVAIAREVLSGWEANLGRKPTLDEKVERIIYYARFDA